MFLNRKSAARCEHHGERVRVVYGFYVVCVVRVDCEREIAFAQSFEVRTVTLTTLTAHTARADTRPEKKPHVM